MSVRYPAIHQWSRLFTARRALSIEGGNRYDQAWVARTGRVEEWPTENGLNGSSARETAGRRSTAMLRVPRRLSPAALLPSSCRPGSTHPCSGHRRWPRSTCRAGRRTSPRTISALPPGRRPASGRDALPSCPGSCRTSIFVPRCPLDGSGDALRGDARCSRRPPLVRPRNGGASRLTRSPRAD